MAKETCQIIRAINYGQTMQDFFVLHLCRFEDMYSISKALESVTDKVEIGVLCVKPLDLRKGL